MTANLLGELKAYLKSEIAKQKRIANEYYEFEESRPLANVHYQKEASLRLVLKKINELENNA